LVRYRVHICDIGAHGLTVLAPPLLPRNPIYVIVCRLPGREAVTLHAREIQRILVSRRKQTVLRVGLRVVTGDPERLLWQPVAAASTKAPAVPATPRERMGFQLPACARLNGTPYLCHTLDMDAAGLTIIVADDFPDVGVFDLWFTDPSGGEIPLLVQEKSRCENPDNPAERQLDLLVIGGARAFRHFLSRYSPNHSLAAPV
jgi:hypothetical protein